MKKDLASDGIEEKILEILKDRIISTSRLAKELGIKRYILVGYLESMKNRRLLEFHKVGRANVYTVAKKVKE
jgi:predicted transcriptional regulator